MINFRKSLLRVALFAAFLIGFAPQVQAGFTVTAKNGNSAGGGSVTVTITIPAGATVGVVAVGTVGGSGTGIAGTLVDNNGVTYTAQTHNYNGGLGTQTDTFSSINAAAATSVTYTAPTNTGNNFNAQMAVWVLTPTAGTVTVADSKALATNTPGTATNGVTTGNLAISTGDGIVLGLAYDSNSASLTAGTTPAMVQDGTNFQSIYEHIAATAATPATWTSSSGSDVIMYGAIAFQITASGGAAHASQLPLSGVGI
jgi:hypothetical protein